MQIQKRISTLVGIIVIVAVAVVILAISVFYFKFCGKCSNTDSPWCPIRIVLCEKMDQTAGWKTYRNDEYGFEFEYPKDWKTSQNKILNGLSIKLFPDSNSNKGSLTISIESRPYAFCSNCTTLDDIVSKNAKILEGSVQNLTPREGLVQGIRAVELPYRTSSGYQGSSMFFISNDKLYSISYFEAGDIANKYENEYRDIIKSIKLNF